MLFFKYVIAVLAVFQDTAQFQYQANQLTSYGLRCYCNHNVILGTVGIVWYMAWLLLIFNTPADHPRISPKEQYYIETAIKEEMQSKQDEISAKVIQ